MFPKTDNYVHRLSLVAFTVLMMAVLLGTLTARGFVFFSVPSFLLYGGLALYVVAAYKFDLSDRFGLGGKILYFTFHLALFVGFYRLPISRNYLFLLAMPVVSQAAAWLRWQGIVLVCTAYLVAMTFVFYEMKPSWANAFATASVIVPAFAFVVAFSSLAKNALVSRTHAECLATQLEQANAQLRASAEQNAALAAANERNRIARDIHDGVGHYLTVVTVQLQAAKLLIREQPQKAEDAVAKAEAMSRAALEEVRRSVSTLRSASPLPPLTQVLQGLVAEAEPQAKLDVIGTPRRLPDAMEQAVFRTVQEGLTNARKHAQAAHLEVVLDFETPGMTRVSVRDDGRGCQSAPAGGCGLPGLRERVAACGGKLSASNRAEGGFVLQVEVPA